MIAQVVIHHRQATCESRNGFCPDWIAKHLGDYVDPLVRHVELTVVAVVLGFVVAFALGLLAHRRRWLIPPITAVTGILFTIPSLALFAVLVTSPLGFGFVTGVIPLVLYTLQIIFRNVVTGLAGVPAEARDAARGMGMTDRQLLWRVEVPLALPEIVAGLRIATVTTVALATLAFYAGAGGLGQQIETDIAFKSNIALAGALAVTLALALDLLLLGA
ncbi:MAG: transporter permease [Solirubrobacteraceae bacterium]|nr:transporter permease [Solirubrobacteraceae bacterium]